MSVAGDVTSYADCEAIVNEAMATFGRIDIFVNNAGWADGRLVRTERCEPEMFARMVGTDLVGLFYMTRAAAPDMLRGGGGSIINLSSIFGNAGAENRTAGYFAAKGGVNQLTKLLACEWGDRNLRVNALAPNFFLSEMTRTLLEDSGMADWMRSRTPMRRMGELPELVGPSFSWRRTLELCDRRGAERRRGMECERRLRPESATLDEWSGEMSTPIWPSTPTAWPSRGQGRAMSGRGSLARCCRVGPQDRAERDHVARSPNHGAAKWPTRHRATSTCVLRRRIKDSLQALDRD